MSTERWDHNGVSVVTYVGPISDPPGERQYIQITVGTPYVSMNMDEWESLVLYAHLVGDEPRAYEWLDREYDRGLVRDGIMICVDLGKKSHD